ncbi:MAG: endonuclease/exonuclease/phosphatase family protein [Thermoleophilia bacterium]|nr:endonuclease/exonuclease/phosphatase family protein [Thermoleophilia bacterium]
MPASKKRTDATETTAALHDTAAWIRKKDPDVVVLQEIDDDRSRPGKKGVNEQLRRLARLINADGASMAAGSRNKDGDLYDNAIMTRNGFKLRQNHAVDLPDKEYDRDRALGAAGVRTPDGQDLTVLYTHTTTRGNSNKDLQDQLDAIGEATRTIRATGKLRYEDSVTGESRVARNLSRDNVVLAGDFNALAPRVYDSIGRDTLRDVADDPQILADPTRARAASAPSHKDRRIDHIFTAPGMQVSNAFVEDVTANEVKDDGVTDHRGVIADVLLAPPEAS